ncbi:MAG: electron transfer flavoprotein subunit beta/FixA family protein [Deltaproteobacteria bacterium]|nr:electron transfer flavoprotein subunit beta/FixA family protein [Deltaproteobacteria bacterium]
MNIVVCMRYSKVIKGDIDFTNKKSIDFSAYKSHVNEWDLYALEEALKIKGGKSGKVSLITLGDENSKEALFYGMAAGADEAIFIPVDEDIIWDNFRIAYIISKVLKDYPYSLILTGIQGEDDASGEVGASLAYLLSIPHATAITSIESINDDKIEVIGELEEEFTQRLKLKIPAVLTIQSGINQPRYVSTMRIRRAKKQTKIITKEIDISDIPFRKKIIEFSSPVKEGRKVEWISGNNPSQKAENLLSQLKEKGVL